MPDTRNLYDNVSTCMKPFRLDLAVFVFAAVLLSWNLWNVGIASGYIDPVLHFGAQDEAAYTREAIIMAREGGWMTPTFLGRWVFEKPPLLMWLSALSMKTFGIGRLAARLPVIFAGALICALIFSIVRRERTVAAAAAAAAMALTSQVLFIMSRHSMTDILLAATSMCAIAILMRDPELRGSGSFVGFVAAATAGILAKSIAGLLILGVMGLVVAVRRGRWTRGLLAAFSAIVVASPWFLYNFILHRDWFVADMKFQLITIGTASHQNTSENHLWFYIVRILNSDLLPLLLAIAAAPALWRAVRRREPAGWLTAGYLAIYFAALMVFRFSSEQYLCWFVPSLILMAGLYSPLLNGKSAIAVVTIAAAVFALKIANPDSAFGVSTQSGSTIAAAPVLARYCGERRAVDLYILGVDDEFNSAALPLHRVRYGWVDAGDLVASEHPYLEYLGILIPAAELPRLDKNLPMYRNRLRAWGLDSTQAVATGISAHNNAELLQIVRDHPQSDFLVSRAILPDPGQAPAHRVTFSGPEFTLIESGSPAATETPSWTCQM